MLIDSVSFYAIELRHHLLCQPDVFIPVAHLNGSLAAASDGYEGQILRAFPDSLISQHAISHLCSVAG